MTGHSFFGISKAKTELSKTALSVLHNIYLSEIHGYKEEVTNKYVKKGLAKEDEGIRIYQKVQSEYAEKNELKYFSPFIAGTPDLIFDDKVVDIKSNWNIRTFHLAGRDSKNKYAWQLIAYKSILKHALPSPIERKMYVCNVLIDNDEDSILQDIKSECYKRNLFLGSELAEVQEQICLVEDRVRKNNIYNLTDDQRIKMTEIVVEDFSEKEEHMFFILGECRKYLNSITL
jgi:hypothetical protein